LVSAKVEVVGHLPQEVRQYPVMNEELHLPQEACCAQVYEESGGVSEQVVQVLATEGGDEANVKPTLALPSRDFMPGRR
jgi:hypothetical protein